VFIFRALVNLPEMIEPVRSATTRNRAVSVEETIQVRCSRCKGKFRDKVRRVRDGYSRQCPSCERMMFFIDGSPNKDIGDALREAQRVRKLLVQEEQEAAMALPKTSAPEAEACDAAPGTPRQVDRRVRAAGRATNTSR
jgi:hypothetical protein